MTVYYNECNPTAAQWIRNLVSNGLLPPGDVDGRSIEEVCPADLAGYDQCHFFAGIGGWPYAARLAGWPDDRPLWTGSCPCQPFSVAGRRGGTDDPRHLWPHFLRLIRACRPPVVMGEQVAGKAGYAWFDGVSADLEGVSYASRAVDVPACAVDAPHIRSRLYWLAVGNASGERRGEGRSEPSVRSGRSTAAVADVSIGSGLGNAAESGLQERDRGRWGDGAQFASPLRADGRNGSFWSDHEWIRCHDGKSRRAEPGTPLLVARLPGGRMVVERAGEAPRTISRVAAWEGLGNAVNAVLAAEVIAAFMDACALSATP